MSRTKKKHRTQLWFEEGPDGITGPSTRRLHSTVAGMENERCSERTLRAITQADVLPQPDARDIMYCGGCTRAIVFGMRKASTFRFSNRHTVQVTIGTVIKEQLFNAVNIELATTPVAEAADDTKGEIKGCNEPSALI